jgi:hypothetical protein
LNVLKNKGENESMEEIYRFDEALTINFGAVVRDDPKARKA